MHKSQGVFRKQTGLIGGITTRQVNGRIITSEKVTRSTSKTLAQMVRYVQLASPANPYCAFADTLYPSLEDRPAVVSEHNASTSGSLDIFTAYFFKDEADQSGTVVAAYQVTRGSLPGTATSPVAVPA